MNLVSTDTNMRANLLRELPLFSLTPANELQELADHFHDVVFAANQILVKEGELVDCVYIIVEGTAEVSHQDATDSAKVEILAVLRPGEAIGLDSTGFYSKSGARTATVKAVTPLFALRMEVSDFKKFLANHPTLNSEMLNAADYILRMHFIKRLEPFSEINHDTLQNIALHIQEYDAPAGEIIFHQGDVADNCYFIRSGTILIQSINQDGSENEPIELTEDHLFGEIGLLTNSKRNATVSAMTSCKLYFLTREHFKLFVEDSEEISIKLTDILMARHKPEQCEGVTIHTRIDSNNNKVVILKNNILGVYCKLPEEGLFVWQLIDGQKTIQDLALLYFYEHHTINVEGVYKLVLQLMHQGFVKKPQLVSYVKRRQLSFWDRVTNKVSDILQYQYSIRNVNSKLTVLYQKFGYAFFTKLGQILMASITVCGLIAFFLFLPHVHSILYASPNAFRYIVLMSILSNLTIPLHELAHALTTIHFGRQVQRMGVGWFWISPVAFTDTSDMWLSPRGPRIAVDLAGIYLNWTIAGLAVICSWACLSWNPELAACLWLVGLYNYLIGYYNLDPLIELDGYLAIMNFFEIPNLRARAALWLIRDFKKTCFSTTLMRKFLPEITYWLACIFFIFSATIISYLIFVYIMMAIIPTEIFHYNTVHLRWVVVILVLIFSFVSLYMKVKQQADVSL